ncbi:hypothetical protein CEXT_683421 [Caerostris extrusa]|uniref:Uncharacterized protein n=1 Tax=Caerostris extrusa TaxID=172846 RepID=A0AAV4Y567_CAEEX|nr:hypothetical protein CEXT_683421 [Caerostris extrusa]
MRNEKDGAVAGHVNLQKHSIGQKFMKDGFRRQSVDDGRMSGCEIYAEGGKHSGLWQTKREPNLAVEATLILLLLLDSPTAPIR